MRNVRVRWLGALVATAVVAGTAAAPASAQDWTWFPTDSPIVQYALAVVGKPPCTPNLPADQAVNCAFDDAVWGLNKAEWAALTGQAVFNQEMTVVSQKLEETTTTLDGIEQGVMDEVCRQLEIPEEECPRA